MAARFPCKICNNHVAKNHKAAECDNCGLRVHIKCNKINTIRSTNGYSFEHTRNEANCRGHHFI